jgi:hypothetical protein
MSHKVFIGMGHEKEPSQPHGPRESGKTLVHSHSARPKRHIKGASMKPMGRKRGRRM